MGVQSEQLCLACITVSHTANLWHLERNQSHEIDPVSVVVQCLVCYPGNVVPLKLFEIHHVERVVALVEGVGGQEGS